MIGTSGEKEFGKSVLTAKHDDNDDVILSLFTVYFAQSTAAVEYTNWISAASVLDMALNNLMVRFQ